MEILEKLKQRESVNAEYPIIKMCLSLVLKPVEWTPPAFAFAAEAGTHLPTPEGWKAKLPLGGWLITYRNNVTHPFSMRCSTIFLSELCRFTSLYSRTHASMHRYTN